MEIFCPQCGQLQESAKDYGRHMVQEHDRDAKVMRSALSKLGFEVSLKYMTHISDDYSKDDIE